MRRYVLATHGEMAGGMRTTLELIVGQQENLTCINAYTKECPDPITTLQEIISKFPEDEIIIMTDLLGGSVNNNALAFRKNPKVHVVTGVNLAVVIGIVMSEESVDIKEAITQAITEAKEQMVYCNDLSVDAEEEDF